MQTQDHRKVNNSSGNEGHGVHVCRKCGWAFPNPHPSAKNRRAHKKICGTIEGYKTHLDASDDEHISDNDSKTPPSLKVVKKAAEVSISRKSSSGVGSRSSRSTRSDEDVFSDAVADFADAPAVVGSSVGVSETTDVIQDLSVDVGVTQLDAENAVAGDLYPPNSGNGTQLQNVECSRPENERLEINMPSQHHLSSSTVDSISNSDSSFREASVSESTLQCSKIDIVLDSEEKVSLEAALGTTSEDAANIPFENAGKTSEAVLLPQKVNGDDMEFVPAGAAMEVVRKQVDEFGDNNDCSNEVSSEKGTVEVDKSEDIRNIPADFASKTSEAVSVSQLVNGGNLELLPANAAMEVIERQREGFDAKNDCFSKDDFVGHINSIEEDSNVEAGSSLEILEGHGSHVLVVPDALPSKEHSEGVLKDYEDHKTEKLPDAAVTLDHAREVECVEHGKDDVNKDALSITSLDESSKNLNKNSGDIISEAIHQEDSFAEEVSVEKKMGITETHSTNDDNEVGQDETLTSTEEQNSLVFIDTNWLSVLDDSGNLAHSHDCSEHDRKDAKIFDALEADSMNVEEEKLRDGVVDYDIRSRGVEENLSGSTLIVAESDYPMDDKVEVQRDDEHGSEAAMSESSKASLLKCDLQKELEDSEAAVKDLGSSGIDNHANMNVETHNEENCVHKASDSVDVSLFNNVMSNDTQQDEKEVFEDANDLESFDEKVAGEDCLGKVDLGLISDNDDSIDLTHITANKSEAVIHVEAVSAVEDRLTEKKDGSGPDFTDGNENLVKQEQAVPELDAQVDSISQTDSLEGNWGSVSVLSAFSDAPAATETGSQPSQSSAKVEKASLQPKSDDGKSDIFKPPNVMTSPEKKENESDQNEGAPEAEASEKPHEKANDSSGSKKNEEIIAKVTNWSTASGKQHMSLKSFLGESSPNVKDKNPPLMKSQETEKAITNTTTKEPEGEMQKEWDSPARYATNIKREKGKVRSKPYWAPFICCSSVQTS